MLKEKLTEAIDKKELDFKSFIWKSNKTLDKNGKYQQSEKKLLDMSEIELNCCYNHCKTMLFNRDSQNPGRYLVLEIISDQKDRCGAELFLRFLEQNKNMTRFTLLGTINEFLSKNREVFKLKKPILEDVFSSIPTEYEKLPLSLIVDGCLDKLGAFNKKHITRTFILKHGIWLTPAEVKDLTETEYSETTDRLSLIRERLSLKDVEKLYINSKGINFTQMRAMLNLKPNKKYIDLTTAQLETLRYKMLFNLEETVKNHISSWEKRMEELELVANYKNFKL